MGTKVDKKWENVPKCSAKHKHLYHLGKESIRKERYIFFMSTDIISKIYEETKKDKEAYSS